MKRIVHLLLGVGFTTLGALFVLGFGTVLFRQNAPIAAIGLVLGAFGLLIGLLTLTVFAYEVGCDKEGLNLHFVFTKETVPWSRVLSYRKVGVTWGFQTEGSNLRAGVFVILKYQRLKHGIPAVARVYFWLVATGPGFSTSSADYLTLLDRYIPDKNRQGRPTRPVSDSTQT